ncbi:hypothetical protein SAMN06295900_1104 [Trinickia caryophylli]|uniref:Uncharacterized protein n=1 Tax=Trinickia caryophylli TaxID=28094 RepID=A0A1X7FN33_TRICW|nr:hypothetical protein SAMN06295900_1104 [Trinickia caryophylli]
MAVECHGAAVDQHVGVAFRDHATIMSRSRACAFVSHARPSTPHDSGLLAAGLHLAAVARGVADSDYAAHQGFNSNGSALRGPSHALLIDASGGLTMTMLAMPFGRRFTVALAPPSR